MNNETETAGFKRAVKSYVLRQGRMSDAQRRSYDELSSKYCLTRKAGMRPGGIGNAFPKKQNPLIIEIGFGMGSATALIAAENPGINYLGIEVHRPGIGKLLWEIEKRSLFNVRIFEGDASEILAEEIPENCASGFHIFFPDPWPKKRHNKRRGITRPFTNLLVSRLLCRGYIYMVTDSTDYAGWAMEELSLTDGITNPWSGYSPPQLWRPETKFEKKGIDKLHEVRELYFIKG